MFYRCVIYSNFSIFENLPSGSFWGQSQIRGTFN